MTDPRLIDVFRGLAIIEQAVAVSPILGANITPDSAQLIADTIRQLNQTLGQVIADG